MCVHSICVAGTRFLLNLILNFSCPECEESVHWVEYNFQMVPVGNQVGTSALSATPDWAGGPYRYWPSQNWGCWHMAAKCPWCLVEAHHNCTQRNGRCDYCWEDRVEVCQRSKRYDHFNMALLETSFMLPLKQTFLYQYTILILCRQALHSNTELANALFRISSSHFILLIYLQLVPIRKSWVKLLLLRLRVGKPSMRNLQFF